MTDTAVEHNKSLGVWSMKKRLILGLLVLLIPLRFLMGYLSLDRMEASIIKAFDLGIEDNMRGLATLASVRDGKVVLDVSEQTQRMLENNTLDSIFFQVIGANGEYIGGNAHLPLPTSDSNDPTFIDSKLNQDEIRLGTMKQEISGDGVQTHFYIQVAQTLRGRYHAFYFTLFDFIETLVLTSLLIAVSVWWCVRRSLMPLEKIKRNLIERGPLDFRPLDETPVAIELRPLVQAFNTLLSCLDNDMNVQRRFLENAAHELKTPLAGLKTQIELTMRESNPQKRSSLLSDIKVSVDRTSNLSKKLLAVSNASALRAQTRGFTRCDLVKISEDVILAYLPEADAKSIDLGFVSDDQSAIVMGDSSALYELVANLVENAIRYSTKGGKVTVQVNDGLTPTLSVADDGRGIPVELREQVFERFYRVLGTKVEGSGLGLAIVKEIAETHHAKIRVESGPNDQGTIISIFFPALTIRQEIYGTGKSIHPNC